MNKREMLNGLTVCESEIKSLRSTNEKLSIELNAMNRVLEAVNSHRPDDRGRVMSEDILYELRMTKRKLKEEIENDEKSMSKVTTK